MKFAVVAVMCAVVGSAVPARAQVAESPYYMCFAYTQDGMFFAGGDFDFSRARTMLGRNCSMPKTVTVVLLKTLMYRKSGKIITYAR